MFKALVVAVAMSGVPFEAFAQEVRDTDAVTLASAPVAEAGGVAGGIAEAAGPRFRHFVLEEGVTSYAWAGHPTVAVGDVLPFEGVTLLPIPLDWGVTEYQYTVVDGQPVLVNPLSRRVVEVIP
jgi:hypothetical protein